MLLMFSSAEKTILRVFSFSFYTTTAVVFSNSIDQGQCIYVQQSKQKDLISMQLFRFHFVLSCLSLTLISLYPNKFQKKISRRGICSIPFLFGGKFSVINEKQHGIFHLNSCSLFLFCYCVSWKMNLHV